MSDGSTKSGPPAYSAGFLPAVYQGTVFRSGQTVRFCIWQPGGRDARGAAGHARLHRASSIGMHERTRPADSTLDARIASYELAYRMQSSAPEAVDFSKETDATKKLYGIGEPATDDFGQQVPAGPTAGGARRPLRSDLFRHQRRRGLG